MEAANKVLLFCILLTIVIQNCGGQDKLPMFVDGIHHEAEALSLPLQNEELFALVNKNNFKKELANKNIYNLEDLKIIREKSDENNREDDDIPRYLRQATSPGSNDTVYSSGENGSSISDTETTLKPDDPLKWITYLLLAATIILIILLLAVIAFLSYFMLHSKAGQPKCKEFELQCRCEQCTTEANDDNEC